MAKKKIIKRRRQTAEAVMEDFFAKNNKKPDFLEFDILQKFMSERGKVLPRSRTGLSAKNQRRLAREVKRARFLAFIPYTVKPE